MFCKQTFEHGSRAVRNPFHRRPLREQRQRFRRGVGCVRRGAAHEIEKMIPEPPRVHGQIEPRRVHQRRTFIGHDFPRTYVDDGREGRRRDEIRAQAGEDAAGAGGQLRRPRVVQQTEEQRARRIDRVAACILEDPTPQVVFGRGEQPVNVVAGSVERRNAVLLRQRHRGILVDDGTEEGIRLLEEHERGERQSGPVEAELQEVLVSRRFEPVPPVEADERNHVGEHQRVPCRLVRHRLAGSVRDRARQLADDPHRRRERIVPAAELRDFGCRVARDVFEVTAIPVDAVDDGADAAAGLGIHRRLGPVPQIAGGEHAVGLRSDADVGQQTTARHIREKEAFDIALETGFHSRSDEVA